MSENFKGFHWCPVNKIIVVTGCVLLDIIDYHIVGMLVSKFARGFIC